MVQAGCGKFMAARSKVGQIFLDLAGFPSIGIATQTALGRPKIGRSALDAARVSILHAFTVCIESMSSDRRATSQPYAGEAVNRSRTVPVPHDFSAV